VAMRHVRLQERLLRLVMPSPFILRRPF
jgi:hypothetical protein